MNGSPRPRHHDDDALRADLARLVPAPAVDEPSPGRLRLVKEQIMTQIEQDAAVRRPGPTARPVRRRRFALAAAAVAAAVAVTVVVHPWTSGSDLPHVTAAPGVVALLDRAAGVAGAEPAVTVGAGQFVYVRSQVTFTATDVATGKTTLGPVHPREIWLSADGGKPGLLREYGKDTPLGGNPHPSVNDPTYEFLAALPTDPTAVLRKIYHDTQGEGTSHDTEAFTTIGDLLLESLCPPAQAAALFKAAERVPGVEVVTGATDHLGRPALAVGRVDPYNGIRTQWLFDPSTYAFLGEYSVATRDLPAPDNIHAGDVIGVDSVETRGVVDQAGTVPRQGA